jgi:hypothetical protein
MNKSLGSSVPVNVQASAWVVLASMYMGTRAQDAINTCRQAQLPLGYINKKKQKKNLNRVTV